MDINVFAADEVGDSVPGPADGAEACGRIGAVRDEVARNLLEDHFIDAASQLVAAERIVSLVDDELKLLEAANEDPLACSIRVDGSIEENVALLEPDVGQVYVEELDRLGLLKVVPIW